MFVPEDGIDEAAAAAAAGYSGSSKDSYYLSKSNTMESSWLHRRKMACACDPYMKLKWGCLLTPRKFEREAATTPLGSSKKSIRNCQMLWQYKHAEQGSHLMILHQVLLLVRMSFWEYIQRKGMTIQMMYTSLGMWWKEHKDCALLVSKKRLDC